MTSTTSSFDAERINVAVLGAGTWGAVLAQVMAPAAAVRLWSPTGKHLEVLSQERTHPHLPDLRLDARIEVTGSLPQALKGARVLVIAVASRYVRAVMREAAPLADPASLVCIASKGMEPETGLALSQIASQELPGHPVVVASGGSHAEEVVRNLPFGMTLAGDADGCRLVKTLLSHSRGRFVHCGNMLGVEIAAALKNVVAVVAGIADGLGMGDNFRACYLVDALEEIGRFAAKTSGEELNALQYGVFGDLLATALSTHSRNFRYGRLLGSGMQSDRARQEIDMVVEGLDAARSLLTRPLAGFPVLEASARLVASEHTVGADELLARLGY